MGLVHWGWKEPIKRDFLARRLVFQAFRKLDDMCGKLTEQLRKLAKQVLLRRRAAVLIPLPQPSR